jgi:hypothetical protein
MSTVGDLCSWFVTQRRDAGPSSKPLGCSRAGDTGAARHLDRVTTAAIAIFWTRLARRGAAGAGGRTRADPWRSGGRRSAPVLTRIKCRFCPGFIAMKRVRNMFGFILDAMTNARSRGPGVSDRRKPRLTLLGSLLDRDLSVLPWMLVRALANPLCEIARQSKARFA